MFFIVVDLWVFHRVFCLQKHHVAGGSYKSFPTQLASHSNPCRPRNSSVDRIPPDQIDVNVPLCRSTEGTVALYQEDLDFLSAPRNGFGGIINYSHVEGETEDGEDALLGDQFSGGVSPVSYNVIAYWQNEKVNLRLSYNYRDRYKLDGIGSFTGFEDRFVKARGQLDMLATYRMKKWLFGFRVYNITEELYEEYKGISKMKVGRTNWDGRTYSLSAAYTF